MQESNILINQTTALGMHSGLNDRLITDWTVENMNPDVILCWMCIDK